MIHMLPVVTPLGPLAVRATQDFQEMAETVQVLYIKHCFVIAGLMAENVWSDKQASKQTNI